MRTAKTIRLHSQSETLTFDAASGRLTGCHTAKRKDHNLLASSPAHPAWIIHYLENGAELAVSSLQARRLTCRLAIDGERQVLTMRFSRVSGLALGVVITVSASRCQPGTRWRLALDNRSGHEIVQVQFPFVVAAMAPQGSLLLPVYAGKLINPATPEAIPACAPEHWRFTEENGDSAHYPGGCFAQFLAYYTGGAGLYLACEDTEAHVKLIKATYRDPGLRLGIAHVGDWPADGRHETSYDTLLRTFQGDWYDAAAIYRDWTLRQPWATPLHQRRDIPQWLLDSPAYISLRLQGELDIGPVYPVREFLPYRRILPLLDRLARAINASLAVILMAWERGGPWVYPDCFPPIGGDAGLRRFCRAVRRRGWRSGSFCNGSRWVTRHFWNDYDGHDYFLRHNGAASVCRTPGGAMWRESWDTRWRPSFACCLGEPATRRTAAAFVARLLKWGMESIQFFDQNMGAATFPCFAANHPHPPVPGRWMAQAMRATMAAFRAAEADTDGLEVIHSTEAPCNETCLPLFQQCDVRVIPPGHVSNYDFLPLYHFLYHECIILQGGMGMGPEPHHLPTRNACNIVLGQIPGAVLTAAGTLLNRDTGNWAPSRPAVGSQEEALAVLRHGLALRRGAGRDFLVFGRMERPAAIDGIPLRTWQANGRLNRIPAVFHAAWRAPDGRFAIVLANWTGKAQRLKITDRRLGRHTVTHTTGFTRPQPAKTADTWKRPVSVTIAAHGFTLVSSCPGKPCRQAGKPENACKPPLSSQNQAPKTSTAMPHACAGQISERRAKRKDAIAAADY